MLQIEPIPAFQDNYIWAVHDGHAAAVVDPGEAAPVLQFLRRRGLVLGAIVITHHHGDHVGGIEALLAEAPRAAHDKDSLPVIGPAGETIPARTQAVREGDRVTMTAPAMTLQVIDVPGHTRGHIAYWGRLQGEAAPLSLFCGDTLFATGCGRLFEGTPAQMLASLDKLAALPDDTRVYCAHEYTASNVRFARTVEPANAELDAWSARVAATREAGQPTLPTTIGLEKQVNPFLRVRVASVIEAVDAQRPSPASDTVATFAGLRSWKDGFR